MVIDFAVALFTVGFCYLVYHIAEYFKIISKQHWLSFYEEKAKIEADNQESEDEVYSEYERVV